MAPGFHVLIFAGQPMSEYANRTVRMIACIILAVSVWCGVSNAYVLQGPQVLELMTKNMGSAKRLIVFQSLQLFDPQQESRTIEFNETLRYNFPDRFRSDIVSDNARRIHVMSAGDTITIMDEQISPETETRFNAYKDVILCPGGHDFGKRLARLGIDVSISSLGKFQNDVAYVIGARYPDVSESQIWIDKTSFRPFRWLLKHSKETSAADGLEIRYRQWQKTGKIWYPMITDFFISGRLIRKVNVKRIEVNPVFPDDTFDINQLKSRYQPSEQPVLTQPETVPANEIQQTIENFNKIYE